MAASESIRSDDRSVFDEHAYKILAGGAFGLVIVATIAYRLLEDWTWVDSLYFSVVAVTTVGFGDLTPSTDASKLFTILYVVSGVTLIATYLDTAMKRRAARSRRHGRSDRRD